VDCFIVRFSFREIQVDLEKVIDIPNLILVQWSCLLETILKFVIHKDFSSHNMANPLMYKDVSSHNYWKRNLHALNQLDMKCIGSPLKTHLHNLLISLHNMQTNLVFYFVYVNSSLNQTLKWRKYETRAI